MRRHLLLALVTGGLLFPMAVEAIDRTYNGGTGDFLEAEKWTPVGSPGVADVAIINSGTVTLDSAATVAGLQLNGGTLTGSGTLTVSGSLSWSGGTMRGSGTTDANGGMTITSNATVGLNDTRTLNNAMAATWTGAASFSNGAAATLVNLEGASFAIDTAADFFNGNFVNQGTVTKTAGSGDGTTRITAAFNNSGTVTVSSGRLQLEAGGTHDGGSFAVAAPGTLEFAAGTHTVSGAAMVSGDGTLEFGGGTTTISGGTYEITGTTRVSGGSNHQIGAGVNALSVGALVISAGSLALSSGEMLTLPSYEQTGGTLDGSDTLVVSGPLTWSGGTMRGGGTTNANGGMTITSNAPVALNDTRTLNNAMAATWTGAASFGNGAATTLVNLATGSFAIDTAADFFGGNFVNQGAVTKMAGSGDGTTRFTAAFNNSGTVTVNSGRLQLEAGGMHDGGSFAVAAPGTLEFAAGTHSVSGAATVSGDGTLEFGGGTTTISGGTYQITGTTRVSGGSNHEIGAGVNVLSLGALVLSAGSLALSSGEMLTVPSYEQTGGTLDGSDTLVVSGPLTWSGGIMRGSGTTDANEGMTITSSTTVGLNDTRTLNNAAAATWTGAASFSNGAAATLVNLPTASFAIDTAADFLNGNFINQGALTKTAGSGDGTTRFSGAFTNSGTVEIVSGTLDVSGGFSQSAGVTRLNGGALSSVSKPINVSGGLLEGTGTITGNVVNGADVAPGLSPGALAIAGTYSQNAPGRLDVEIGGTTPGTEFDRLTVSGVATLGGTLAVALTNGFTPTVGESFEIMTFGSRTGQFTDSSGLVTGVGFGFRPIIGANNVVLQFSQEICGDGMDNDGDGAADCADLKCADFLACTFTPTATATVTTTPSATSDPTATQTATLTATPSQTPSPTPTMRLACAGDCNENGFVTIEELIRGVNIALGAAPLETCPQFDGSGNGLVEINELITGVNNALGGCPSGASPTPTVGGTTPTAVPGQAVAGGATAFVSAMGVIPNVAAAIVNGLQVSGAALVLQAPLDGVGGPAGACPLGGEAVKQGSFPLNLTITMTQCGVPTSDGSVTFDGTISLRLTSFTLDVDMAFADTVGTPTLTAAAQLAGSLVPTPGGTCFLTAATINVSNGTLSATTVGGATAAATFQGTQVVLDQIMFDAECVPLVYRLRFDGPVALQGPNGDPLDVTLTDLVMAVDDRGASTVIDLAGGMDSACLGGSTSIATDTPITVPGDEICPTAGQLSATLPGSQTRIHYRADQSVDIDSGADGSIDVTAPNCLDPRLIACLG